ncbi:MAG: SMI1/KNR4 family protein [Planctomycetota bacterium]
MPKINSSLPKLRSAQVTQLELFFGLKKLPATYRRWILAHNGGSATPAFFDWKHPKKGKRTQELYRLLGFDTSPMDVKSRPLDIVSATLRYRDYLPPSSIVIGMAEPSDVLTIQIGGKSDGQVSLIDWDDAVPGSPKVKFVHPIAKSFRDFLDSLRHHDEH